MLLIALRVWAGLYLSSSMSVRYILPMYRQLMSVCMSALFLRWECLSMILMMVWMCYRVMHYGRWDIQLWSIMSSCVIVQTAMDLFVSRDDTMVSISCLAVVLLFYVSSSGWNTYMKDKDCYYDMNQALLSRQHRCQTNMCLNCCQQVLRDGTLLLIDERALRHCLMMVSTYFLYLLEYDVFCQVYVLDVHSLGSTHDTMWMTMDSSDRCYQQSLHLFPKLVIMPMTDSSTCMHQCLCSLPITCPSTIQPIHCLTIHPLTHSPCTCMIRICSCMLCLLGMISSIYYTRWHSYSYGNENVLQQCCRMSKHSAISVLQDTFLLLLLLCCNMDIQVSSILFLDDTSYSISSMCIRYSSSPATRYLLLACIYIFVYVNDIFYMLSWMLQNMSYSWCSQSLQLISRLAHRLPMIMPIYYVFMPYCLNLSNTVLFLLEIMAWISTFRLLFMSEKQNDSLLMILIYAHTTGQLMSYPYRQTSCSQPSALLYTCSCNRVIICIASYILVSTYANMLINDQQAGNTNVCSRQSQLALNLVCLWPLACVAVLPCIYMQYISIFVMLVLMPVCYLCVCCVYMHICHRDWPIYSNVLHRPGLLRWGVVIQQLSIC